MFRGLVAVSVDAKGRLVVPVRFREQLLDRSDGQVVITVDMNDRCLLLYPFQEWETLEQKISGLSTFHPATRRLQRLVIGHATEVDMDQQGRVLVPPLLRDYASIGSKAMWVGQGRRVEIWDRDAWEVNREIWIAEKETHDALPEALQSLSL